MAVDEAGRAFADAVEELFTEHVFAATVEAWQRPGRAYRRPGDPRGLILTDRQWADYDELQAHFDRMEARYGQSLPQSMASMRAVARGIW